MKKAWLAAVILLTGCAASMKKIDIPPEAGTYAYGFARTGGSGFNLHLKNTHTGRTHTFRKWYVQAWPFTPDSRTILFAFPIDSGEWEIEDVVTNAYKATITSKDTAGMALEVLPGKGNFIGDFDLMRADGKDVVELTPQAKARVDSMMEWEDPHFRVLQTTLTGIRSFSGNERP